MRIIPESIKIIPDIVTALQNGQTIVYPTETCYGLGCDATNAAAMKKIFAIKKRQEGKSVLMLMSDVAMVRRYVEENPLLRVVAKTYWPGPLTVVMKKRNDPGFPDEVVRDDGTIAFRISSHPFASELVRSLDRPIVSTSANIVGEENPYDSSEVIAMFDGQEHQPDMLIDAGRLPHRSPSTIIKIENDSYHVLRQGDLVVDIPSL